MVARSMIISYQYNFIFIKTRKTASSTIETLLRGILGPKDIFVGNKELRAADNGKRVTAEAHSTVVAGHMTAKEIVTLVPEQFWRSCFKFTSERHPYEKAVSLAYYNFAKREQKGKKTREFSQFLETTVRKGHYRGFDHYSINGHVVVEDFIRYESLQEDLKRIGQRVGISIPAELPERKMSFRTDRRPAREILNEQQKLRVIEHCKEEFEFLGYAP